MSTGSVMTLVDGEAWVI